MRFERRAAGRAKMDICEWVAGLNRKAAAATARGIVGVEEARRWPMISGVVKTGNNEGQKKCSFHHSNHHLQVGKKKGKERCTEFKSVPAK